MLNARLSPRSPSLTHAHSHARTHAHGCRLTFNLIFGQVDRGAVGEDVRDGAHAPVHQRGGDWVHRHDCDLWRPPAPSSYRNVYWELRNFPPRSPRECSSESMHGRSVNTAESAARSPKCCFWSTTDALRRWEKNGENILPQCYKHRILINAESHQKTDTVCVPSSRMSSREELICLRGSISPPAVWVWSARVRLSPHPLVGCARSPDALRLPASATFAVIHRTGLPGVTTAKPLQKNKMYFFP